MNSTIIEDSSSSRDIFFIAKLDQGFDIRQGFNWMLYISYSCFLVSLLFWKIFWIRSIIAFGSIFFCIWAWTVPDIAVQIDHFSFNLAYVIINVYQNFRLLKKMYPPKLTEIERTIYERDFKEVFNEHEFDLLLKKGRAEYISANETQLCKFAQSFKEIIYVAKINDGYTIVLENSKGKAFAEVNVGSWIGIIEYAKREDYIKIPELENYIQQGHYEMIWNISATLRDKEGRKIAPEVNSPKEDDLLEKYEFLKKRSEGCIIYRFPIEVSIFKLKIQLNKKLEKLYADKDIPFVFKNGLQTLWLSYCTEYVLNQNKFLKEYFSNLKQSQTN